MSNNPHKFRFNYDIKTEREIYPNLDHYIHVMNNEALLCSSEFTPKIYSVLKSVLHKLNLDCETVFLYIKNDNIYNAYCVYDEHKCVIVINSSCFNLYSLDEIQFILGHELGHFIFNHFIPENISEFDHFLQSKYHEISADRIGFYCAQSLDISSKTIIKSISGLPDQLLSTDVSHYFTKNNADSNYDIFKTHPNFYFRLKALYWFSLSQINLSNDINLKTIDGKIYDSIFSNIDVQNIEYIKDLKDDYFIWKVIEYIIFFGSFDKQLQLKCSLILNQVQINKIKNFLQLYEKNQLLDETRKRIDDIKIKLNNVSPVLFNKISNNIEKDIRDLNISS